MSYVLPIPQRFFIPLEAILRGQQVPRGNLTKTTNQNNGRQITEIEEEGQRSEKWKGGGIRKGKATPYGQQEAGRAASCEEEVDRMADAPVIPARPHRKSDGGLPKRALKAFEGSRKGARGRRRGGPSGRSSVCFSGRGPWEGWWKRPGTGRSRPAAGRGSYFCLALAFRRRALRAMKPVASSWL